VRQHRQGELIERLGGTPVAGDIADEAVFARLRMNAGYDYIIHAAQAHYLHTAREEINRIEKCAVRNLETLAGASTRLMIFTSGVWSYGTGAGGQPLHEGIVRKPFAAARGRTTLVRELLTNPDFPWVELCPPSLVYGSVGPLAGIIASLRNGGTFHAPADTSVKWSLVERIDLGRAYRALVENGRPRDSFVVAEDQALPILEFYETVRALVGRGFIVGKSRAELAASLDPESFERACTGQPVDSSYFKRRTGWHAHNSFKEALPRFLT
jgi:nucleoside-diphosphate-sugar epimerase